MLILISCFSLFFKYSDKLKLRKFNSKIGQDENKNADYTKFRNNKSINLEKNEGVFLGKDVKSNRPLTVMDKEVKVKGVFTYYAYFNKLFQLR